MINDPTWIKNLEVGLYIRPAARQAIVVHMERHYPHEACGFVFGKNGIGDEFIAMANIADDSAARYAIDPEPQLALFKEKREQGMELVAIVHSHIDTAAYPSAADIASATYPDADYLIMAVNQGQVTAGRAFRIGGNRIIERRVIFRDPPTP